MEKMINYNNIEFYPIPNIDDYFISKCGQVLSTKHHKGVTIRILKPSVDGWGYPMVIINNKQKPRNFKIHKLMALTFLDLPVDENLYTIGDIEINHISEVKTDNSLENLELVTRRENLSYSKKPISGYTGVSYDMITNQFQSRIQINKINMSLGRFDTPEQASESYQIALKNIHLFNGDSKEFRKIIKEKLEKDNDSKEKTNHSNKEKNNNSKKTNSKKG